VTILYCCQDLIFSTKIRSTAESLGVATEPIDGPASLANQIPDNGERPGTAAALMVDLELGDTATALIEQARRQLPEATVIAFGSHVAKDVLKAAKAHGAHHVLPRSAFTQQLPDLLEKYGKAVT